METIRQYMESLFASFPNTPEVLKAKERLLEMSEDKYTNLLEEGISDNEAVAKVIAEFGNLDELKEELGIEEEVKKKAAADAEAKAKKEEPPTPVTMNEAKQMINDFTIAGILTGIGVACFICCVVPCILIENGVGAASLFALIGAGVAMMIIKHNYSSRWKYIEKKKCIVDYPTAEFVKNDKKRSRTLHTILMIVGVCLCVMCVMPAILFDIPNKISGAAVYLADNVGPALMFVMAAAGVGLIVAVTRMQKAYKILLTVNPADTVSATYSKGSGRIIYESKMLEAFMNIYWPLVLCVYLSMSFLTFEWGFTWIIWPVAAIARVFIDNAFGERE